jgi:hypothetical protein
MERINGAGGLVLDSKVQTSNKTHKAPRDFSMHAQSGAVG